MNGAQAAPQQSRIPRPTSVLFNWSLFVMQPAAVEFFGDANELSPACDHASDWFIY